MTTTQKQWISNFAEFLSSDEHRHHVSMFFAQQFKVKYTYAREKVNQYWIQQIQSNESTNKHIQNAQD